MSGNALDLALWNAADSAVATEANAWKRVALRPFDHERRMSAVVVDAPDAERWLIVKGEPESVLAAAMPCRPPPRRRSPISTTPARVIAVAARPAPGLPASTDAEEQHLGFVGFLVFTDRPKADAAPSLARLAGLGIIVKVITGDSRQVAVKVCHDLGLGVHGAMTGDEVDALDDDALGAAIDQTTVFARVGPETKSRIVRCSGYAGPTWRSWATG